MVVPWVAASGQHGSFMCGRWGHDYCVHGRTDWLDAAMAADWRAVVTCQWLLGAQHIAIAIIRLIITQQVVHVCMPGATSMGHVQLLLPGVQPKDRKKYVDAYEDVIIFATTTKTKQDQSVAPSRMLPFLLPPCSVWSRRLGPNDHRDEFPRHARSGAAQAILLLVIQPVVIPRVVQP